MGVGWVMGVDNGSGVGNGGGWVIVGNCGVCRGLHRTGVNPTL